MWEAQRFSKLPCLNAFIATARIFDTFSFLQAVDITRRVHICMILFSLANLAKAGLAKMLSTHFYKTAHFKKLEQALEKEYYLQVTYG